MSGHHRAAAAFELGLHLPVGNYDDDADYDAANTGFAKQWFSDHREKKATEPPPWKRNAAATKTKEQVNYREGTSAEHCGNCTMIRLNAPDFESHSCTLVKGLIEGHMTCDEWYPESGSKKEGVFRDADLPERQRAVFQRYDDPEGWRGISRHFLEVAKNPDPGTHVWRGERRPIDEDLHHAESTGLHWTADPDMAIKGHAWPGQKIVLWQGQVDHPDQHFPRTHPMWYGRHLSLDSEAEVRFRPGAQVKLHGAYVWHHPGGDDTEAPGHLPYPRADKKSDPTAPNAIKPDPRWEWHPMDRTITIRHAGHGASDYSDLGIHREAGKYGELPELHYEHQEDPLFEGRHVIRAHHPEDGEIGNINWGGKAGDHVVDDLYVHPKYRRRGMATELFRRAREIDPHLEHSEERSGDAENWIDSLGAIRQVPSRDGPDGVSKSMMVAIVPPGDVLDHLQKIMEPMRHEVEPRSKMHITLLYLGQEDDHPDAHIARLPDLVRQWAKTQRRFTATTQGAGTFANDGKHVLHALVDIPGSHEVHGSLRDFLKGHGISAIPQDHGFIPHITLAYSKQPIRFVPKVDTMSWPVEEIWYCKGGRWESIPLAHAVLHTEGAFGLEGRIQPARLSLNQSKRLVDATRKNGGHSAHLKTMRSPKGGFMVAQEEGSHIVPAHHFFGARGARILRDYVHSHSTEFAHPRAHLGVWHDTESKNVFLDISHNVGDERQAVEMGKKQNQISVWDVKNSREISTGGTGGLEHTAARDAGLLCSTCGLEKTGTSATMRLARQLASQGKSLADLEDM